jgi:uncharacterized protein (DUF2267 family)
MQRDEFVERVAAREPDADQPTAERATDVVLEALGQRLPEREAGNLASQLAQGLARPVQMTRSQEGGPGGVDGFYDQVATQTGIATEEAGKLTKAVMATLREAVTDAEFADVEANLPEGLEELLA